MITSTSNDTVKHITLLVKSAKARRKEGVFVVEGERIAREIPKGSLKECFVSEKFDAGHKTEEVFGYPVNATVVSDKVFDKMCDTKNPQGILCVCDQNAISVKDLLESKKGKALKLLILEGIQDPGNLGTMVRTAEGAGFDAIIADDDTVDVYNPKVTRSTMGSLFRVPVIYTDDLLAVADTLRQSGVTLYAAHPDARISYKDEGYGNRLAFLIGNEGNGLSEEISGKADKLIGIPMKGKLESLNAAVAAALLMYNVDD